MKPFFVLLGFGAGILWAQAFTPPQRQITKEEAYTVRPVVQPQKNTACLEGKDSLGTGDPAVMRPVRGDEKRAPSSSPLIDPSVGRRVTPENRESL
ncbi:MAG: hypothetical protein N2170_09320 [Bacteroidia bacterium]|nr:hypothetical protein [Bacteroidia bacterium]